MIRRCHHLTAWFALALLVNACWLSSPAAERPAAPAQESSLPRLAVLVYFDQMRGDGDTCRSPIRFLFRRYTELWSRELRPSGDAGASPC
jgi:hypothetical protein